MFSENKSCGQRNVDQEHSQLFQIVPHKDVTGAIHKCTTKAFFVLDLQHDLLGRRALVTASYRVILDKDPRISGFFSVRDKEIDPATGISFIVSEGLSL